jgi:lysozyme
MVPESGQFAGATLVDGKPVRQGMKLTQEKCDQVNAKERDAALAWVDKTSMFR